MAFERMIQAAGSPEMAVQWKMVDQYKGIAEAQAHALEHINMGQVTVYGDTTTGASFAKSFVEKFAPALDMINTGVKGQFKDLFGIGNKDNQQIENKSEKENQDFENVK
jgi:flotillin